MEPVIENTAVNVFEHSSAYIPVAVAFIVEYLKAQLPALVEKVAILKDIGIGRDNADKVVHLIEKGANSLLKHK